MKRCLLFQHLSLFIVFPQEGPQISGSKKRYNIGDLVYINCTSAKSKPVATLKWYINDEPVSLEEKSYN